MLDRFRIFWTKVIKPVANLLIRLGVTPDMVTIVGTLGVVVGALVFFPTGHLWLGVVVISVFVFSDLIDGYMARTMGISSKWGSFLDSTLDRFGDAAIFAGLAIWLFEGGDNHLLGYVALWALVMGSVTSYTRAKAESLGMTAKGGIAERADRLVAILVLTFFSDVLNLPILLAIVLWALAVASTITVLQRMILVRRQALADPGPPPQGSLDAPPRQRLVDYAFGVAWAVTRHSPEPVADRVLESAADRLWKQGGPGVTQLEANLRRAVPDMHPCRPPGVVPAGMRSYFRYWHEVFRLPSWSHERIVDMVVTTNEPPCATCTPRGGARSSPCPTWRNWDLAGAWAGLTGLPVSTVAERLRPESLFNRFVAYRAELGIEVEPLSGAGNPLTAMSAALERGRVVCLLADRSFGQAGLTVTCSASPPGCRAARRRCPGWPRFRSSSRPRATAAR